MRYEAHFTRMPWNAHTRINETIYDGHDESLLLYREMASEMKAAAAVKVPSRIKRHMADTIITSRPFNAFAIKAKQIQHQLNMKALAWRLMNATTVTSTHEVKHWSVSNTKRKSYRRYENSAADFNVYQIISAFAINKVSAASKAAPEYHLRQQYFGDEESIILPWRLAASARSAAKFLTSIKSIWNRPKATALSWNMT